MNGKKEEKLIQSGREQVAKPVAKKIRQIGNELENYVERTANDSELVLDIVYESVAEKKDESLGIERMTTFADLEEDHDVAIVLGIFRKYCNENGYYENSEEIFDFVKKIGAAERIASYRVTVSYGDIEKAEDKDKASEVLFELISLCNSLFGYNEDIYNEICKNLIISQNDLESIRKYINGNVKNYELSKWAEMLLGQTDRTDNIPDAHDSSGLLDSDGNAQCQRESENFKSSSANNANDGTNESNSEENYSTIREMISEIVGGMMKQNKKDVNNKNENNKKIILPIKNNKNEDNEKIYSFIQKYNSHIAFDAAIEYVKLSNAEILFTTCGMNVAFKGQKGLTNIKYADIDSKWVLSTSLQLLDIFKARQNITLNYFNKRACFFCSFEFFHETAEYHAGLNLLPYAKTGLLCACRLIAGKGSITVWEQRHGAVSHALQVYQTLNPLTAPHAVSFQ